MYSTDGDWLCTGPMEIGYVQDRWRLAMYSTDGDWLCTGPMETGYVQDRWRLAMYRTDGDWLCTGPMETGYVQDRFSHWSALSEVRPTTHFLPHKPTLLSFEKDLHFLLFLYPHHSHKDSCHWLPLSSPTVIYKKELMSYIALTL